MEARPIYLAQEDEQNDQPVGAMITLKSTARMGRQLQNLSVTDDSEFDHIVAVTPKMRQVIDQARKLAMHDAPMLIVGDTGTGKDMLARAVRPFSGPSAIATP
ncbi:transcriptional regulator TyrR [Plautia stali symbiont]|nr:transcriptional regulator TyrR [Plautia stali symbiont]